MGQVKTNTVKGIVNFEDAVASAGFGRFNLFLILVAGGCLMSVIIETQSMMFIIPSAQCDLSLSLAEKGILSSINYLGVFTTSHLWGFLADTRGRRLTLLICLFSSFVFSIISSIVPQDWLFIVLRFFNGAVNGGATAVIYAYAGEFHDNRYRPKVVSWVGTFIAIANIILPGVAWWILPGTWSFEIPVIGVLFRPWRLLVIIYAMPSLIFGILLYILPESPKFSLTKGRNAETLEVVKNIYVWNGNDKDSFLATDLFLDEDNPNIGKEKTSVLRSMVAQTTPLFKSTFVWKTAMVCCIQFGLFFSMNGLLMWYPEILNGMNMFAEDNPTESVKLCSSLSYDLKNGTQTDNYTLAGSIEELTSSCTDTINTKVFMTGIVVGIAYVICYFSVGVFISIIGKKNLLLLLLSTTALAGIVAQNIPGHVIIQILIGAFLMGGSGISVMNAIVVDLYPTQIRAMALAIANMAGRLGAVVGTNVTGNILYSACSWFFYVFLIDHIVIGIIGFLLPTTQKAPKPSQPI